MYDLTAMLDHKIDPRILIVDDEVDILETIGFLLEEYGYDVYTSSTGHHIDQVVDSIRPHVIVLDIFLAGIDGREIAKSLKQRSSMTSSIIMISANPNMEASVGLCGADDFLAKPFDFDDLLYTINRQINNPTSLGKYHIDLHRSSTSNEWRKNVQD